MNNKLWGHYVSNETAVRMVTAHQLQPPKKQQPRDSLERSPFPREDPIHCKKSGNIDGLPWIGLHNLMIQSSSCCRLEYIKNKQENMSMTKGKVFEAVSWLSTEAHRIIRASRREMNDGTAAFPPQVGIGYEAFWLRDYEYTLEGSITSYSDKELTEACRLFMRSMNADGAGVDCVKYDGTPIYKPGYGTMGENPVADGSQFTVGVAFHTYQKTRNVNFLREVLTPLVKTMDTVPRNAKTGLVYIDPTQVWDRCPYGLTDTIRKQGDVLFCSLLYVQACRQLSDLLISGHQEDESRKWSEEAIRVAASIRKVFWDADTGLFHAATLKCREHDIWGSAFAVFLSVADAEQSQAIAGYFKTHYDVKVKQKPPYSGK
ncbi:MAG: hypothetical protein HQ557_11580 [Bacteroidetes bacterium]|nr:hypothetical protein [Bacteroidota bacterium]